MTDKPAGATTRVARIIKAPPEPLYAAFVDPDVLIRWLPPAEMTGEIRDFDARVGGGYRLSLFYPPGERAFRGKTTEREDRMTVRFLELEPPRRIVEVVTLDSADPAFLGQMTIVVTLEPVAGGTDVAFLCTNLPPGLRAADNEEGTRLSLEQLARRFE
jgi:uncharacterized protein YndB with AHSA1/START domain